MLYTATTLPLLWVLLGPALGIGIFHFSFGRWFFGLGTSGLAMTGLVHALAVHGMLHLSPGPAPDFGYVGSWVRVFLSSWN